MSEVTVKGMNAKKQNKELAPKCNFKYQSFSDTFKLCSFALAAGFIYPNKTTLRTRKLSFLFILALNCVMLFWFIHYTVKCIVELDIYNTTRNITIGTTAVLFIFKTFYVNQKNDLFDRLLKQITKDLIRANDMEEDYQEIYDYFIKRGKFGQVSYLIIPGVLSSLFPIYAGVTLIYRSLKSDDFKKPMVHDMELKFLEEKQYDSPYFELVFLYCTQVCFIIVPNFTGFDGSFCIATCHLGLKLKLMTHGIKRAMQDSKTVSELKFKLKEMVRDHQEALEFYDLIQAIYGGWLFAVFLLTSLMISCCLCQISLGGIDIKYMLFAVAGVFHMYMPCYFASCLIELGEQISMDIYDTPWESWADPSITRFLIFIMARAQKKLLLKGLGMVVFNMEAFVSLMQTSYSFFTLMTGKQIK